MATYHGITQATCLNCGKVTKEDSTLEMLNDLDPKCLDCQSHLVAWFNQDGRIVVTGEIEEEEIRIIIKGEDN
jgi:NAD-dependent SIR2 family protein deacetylase